MNADQELGDFSSQSAMIKNGWNINVKTTNDPKYFNKCGGTNTWFGYTYGKTVGSISTTFSGYGKAVLFYGNCIGGQVKVYLNGNEINRAHRQPSKEFTFNYSKGDTLSIKEFRASIIKLNSLEIKPN